MRVQLHLSVELGFGFYWVRVSFFFSSDSRAVILVGLGWDSGWDFGWRARDFPTASHRVLHRETRGHFLVPRPPFTF